MLFNSTEFVFLFLPITIVLFYVAPMKWRLAVIFVSSQIFYMAEGMIPFYFMTATIIWGYVFAFLTVRYPGMASKIGALSFPLIIFYLFRYLGFTLSTVGVESPAGGLAFWFLSMALPAGVSFYTFHILSYNIDVWDRKIEPERNFFKLFTYVSFFPQLIAGPILRFTDISSQLDRLGTARKLYPDWRSGVKYIAIGLFGKIFLADLLVSPHSKFILASSTSSQDAVFSVLAYTFRIYFDFWAYSTIAIGLGKLFAINIPVNFDEPYIARNPKEFWRRWHMTLSFWLRDYVYMKLGGNHAYARNILIVFGACGLWHGAGWNFVLWGLLHAVYVLGYRLVARWWDTWPVVVQVGLTFALVSLAWPLFYLDAEQYLKLLRLIFVTGTWQSEIYTAKHWLYVGAVASVAFFARERIWLHNVEPRTVLDRAWMQATLAFIATVSVTLSSTFIYFRF